MFWTCLHNMYPFSRRRSWQASCQARKKVKSTIQGMIIKILCQSWAQMTKQITHAHRGSPMGKGAHSSMLVTDWDGYGVRSCILSNKRQGSTCAPIGPYAMQFSKRDLLICFPIGANHSDAEASEAKCVNACLFSFYHPTLLSWCTTLLRKRAPWRGVFFTFYTFTLYTFILGCGGAWRNTRVASEEKVGSFLVVHGDLAVHLEEKMRVRLSLLMFATTFLCRCCGPFCLLFRPSRLVHGLKCPLNFLKEDSISIPQLFLFIFLLWCVQEIALSTSWFHMVVLVAAPIRDDYGGVFLVFFTKWSTTRIMPPQTKQNQQGDTHTRVICAWGSSSSHIHVYYTCFRSFRSKRTFG